jgi:lipopolysaccharide transport system ATP-binding protein
LQTSSDSIPSVIVDHVSKRYRLVNDQTNFRSIITNTKRWLRKDPKEIDQDNFFWALSDVNFEVRPGEALGIIGPNGAGKTTILKLLSRITKPTHGQVVLNGRFSSLIELGAGFHPDLTGRENVFLNGVILGLTQRQIRERFDEIVAFSELEKFIDMPVKRYSSGMFARLGFAVAAHVDPDIMLIDEVLAVGDASFQQKCYDFLHRFVKSNRTTIFVSHNLYVIEQLCDRVIWLERGKVMMAGTSAQVLSAYMDSQDQKILKTSNALEASTEHLRIDRLTCSDTAGTERDTFESGEDIVFRITYTASGHVPNPHFVLSVADGQGGPPLFLASMLVDGAAPEEISGQGEICCHFQDVPLRPRAYQVWGEVWGSDRAKLLVNWQRMGSFRVVSGAKENLEQRGSIRHSRTDGPILVPYEWEYKDKP